MRRLRYLAALIAVSTLIAAFASGAEGLYVVAGTVVDAGTNSPLSHAYVRIYGPDSDRPVRGYLTGNDGRFSLEMPEGVWQLLAGTRDDQESYGSRDPSSGLGSAVITGPDKDTSALVFRFYRPVVISGRVVDDAGEPATQALVQLVRQTVTAGKRTATVLDWRRTDDLGEYRFDHIAGGADYFLAVSGQPWYSQRVAATSSDMQAAAYAPSYYPGVSDPAKATPVSPRPGEEVRADFRLYTVVNSNISVKYDGPPGLRGSAVLTNEGVAGTAAVQQNQQLNVFAAMPRLPDGSTKEPPSLLTFKSVPPGQYTLLITGTAGNDAFGLRTPVNVNGGDISLDLKLLPLMKIEGTVRFPPGVNPKNPVLLSLRSVATGAMSTVSARADGGFTFPFSMAGRYTIAIGGNNGFFLAGLEARGAVVKDGNIEIPEATPVSLTVSVSDKTGGLKGVAMKGDRPVEGVLVVLVSSPGDTVQAGSVPHYRGYQTESDGSFEFRSLPAGRYRIFATDNVGLEYATAEGVAPWLAGAKEVEVRVGAMADERVALSTAPSKAAQ